ncbi:polysaccharide deacetylase [Clostridium sp. MSJ-4]|uniref:Polysaccharide deacetylase n=1 Tax=Clostridium simiarum TaxID=2841506 RepID=A0ABS6EVV3_9CLOT|nr:polysaccharide deacetylase family protein [Clostridium simiarum]MBU5590353.1 polysaccharide deacetylase [Clostridium simiarum]
MHYKIKYVLFFIALYFVGFIGGSLFFSYYEPELEIKQHSVEDNENINYKESEAIDDLYYGDKKEDKNQYKEEGKYDEKETKVGEDKIAYLTFDDGPSKNITPKILDILSENSIKATFFVTGEMAEHNEKIIKDIKNRGHSIGNHSYSHDFNVIYSSIENFTYEVERTEKILKSILGEDYQSKFFRFPGGSFENYKDPYKKVLEKINMKYIDWNALNGDAEYHEVPLEAQLQKIKETVLGKKEVVILLHDSSTKSTTLEALPHIIDYLKNEGYQFKKL